MARAAGSCFLLLFIVFGALTVANRDLVREWWSDFFREVTQ